MRPGRQLRRVARLLVSDLYLPPIHVRNGPIATRLQRRDHSLEKIEPRLSHCTGPVLCGKPGNDQM